MRPAVAQVPLQCCKASLAVARMPKQQASAAQRRRLKSKAAYSNLLSRFLAPKRFSKWISVLTVCFASAMALDPHTLIFAAMQTPVARLTDDMWGRVQMQTNSPALLLPTSLSRRIDVSTRYNGQGQKEDSGLVDKAVTWMLAPVFFCCVAAEKAKPPQNWQATAVFSRVVVSFMLKLFVLVTELTGGQQQTVRRLEEGKYKYWSLSATFHLALDPARIWDAMSEQAAHTVDSKPQTNFLRRWIVGNCRRHNRESNHSHMEKSR